MVGSSQGRVEQMSAGQWDQLWRSRSRQPQQLLSTTLPRPQLWYDNNRLPSLLPPSSSLSSFDTLLQ